MMQLNSNRGYSNLITPLCLFQQLSKTALCLLCGFQIHSREWIIRTWGFIGIGCDFCLFMGLFACVLDPGFQKMLPVICVLMLLEPNKRTDLGNHRIPLQPHILTICGMCKGLFPTQLVVPSVYIIDPLRPFKGVAAGDPAAADLDRCDQHAILDSWHNGILFFRMCPITEVHRIECTMLLHNQARQP